MPVRRARPGCKSRERGNEVRRGLVRTMVGIVREEGLVQLYRGLAPACLRHLVYSGTRVATYEVLRERTYSRKKRRRILLTSQGQEQPACSQAALVSSLLRRQIWSRCKCRSKGNAWLVENRRATRGLPRCVRSIYKVGGLRGLYTGWGPAVQRAMLVQMGDLTAYDQAKQMFQQEPFGVQDGPFFMPLAVVWPALWLPLWVRLRTW